MHALCIPPFAQTVVKIAQTAPRATVALLLVLAVPRFGVVRAEPLEMGVGHVVKHDAAVRFEEAGLAPPQPLLEGFAAREQGIARAVKAVFAALGHPQAEHLGQRRAFGPVDERPFARWLDEPAQLRMFGFHEIG